MTTYAAPGIYVKEEPAGLYSISSSSTSGAAFVGTAPNPRARLGEAVAINNWTEFVRHFVPDTGTVQGTDLSRAVWGFFGNGGGRCYVVNLPPGEPLSGGGRARTGLQLLEPLDDISIVAAPGYVGVQHWEALLEHCERAGDRVAILDTPKSVPVIDALKTVQTLDGPPKEDGKEEPGGGDGGLRPRASSYGTYYFPWIKTFDPLTRDVVDTAPSGHLAGVWARVDSQRGVHKAPANEAIAGALGLTYLVTRDEQAILNPAGVNCLRKFGAEGIRVWGARTLAPEADEFRYLNVRRLFLMLRESIEQGTTWIVFEPNDYKLWTSIQTQITEFLTRVWRDGALFGRTPEEAFFVKCDEETNPPDVRNAGQVIAIVGVAPVKPAEFVIFKLSQWAGGSSTEMIGG